MSSDLIIQYCRKNNVPYATLVAVKVAPKKYAIGFSQCRKGDSFNKNTGTLIAIDRALATTKGRSLNLTHSVKKHIEQFKKRAKKYFKNCYLVKSPSFSVKPELIEFRKLIKEKTGASVSYADKRVN